MSRSKDRSGGFRLDKLISVTDEKALSSEQQQVVISLARKALNGGNEAIKAIEELKRFFGISGSDKIRSWAARSLPTDSPASSKGEKVWDVGLDDGKKIK